MRANKRRTPLVCVLGGWFDQKRFETVSAGLSSLTMTRLSECQPSWAGALDPDLPGRFVPVPGTLEITGMRGRNRCRYRLAEIPAEVPFVRQEIHVKMRGSGRDYESVAVRAWVSGGLAVHRHGEGETGPWTITHVASGLRVTDAPSLRQARWIVSRLLPLADWRISPEKLRACVDPPSFEAVIAAASRLFGTRNNAD